MRRIVKLPVPMQDSSLGFQFAEERCPGIGRENVKSRIFQMRAFDPANGPLENIGAIVIKSEDKAPVHLDAPLVE